MPSRRPRRRPGPGDAGSLDEQAAAAVQRAGQGRRPQVLHRQHGRGRARPGSAPAKLMSPGPIGPPAPASISAKPARLPSSPNPAAVTSPEVSLVARTASRIRSIFLPAQVGELGSDFAAHVPIRERDDEIFNGSHGHGAASFGRRYQSIGSRGDDELTDTEKHHGAASWCHLLPCWGHEKPHASWVPAEVKSLFCRITPSGTALVAVLQDYSGKPLSQQPIRRCAGDGAERRRGQL